jgi:hypothetical protein
MNITQQLGLLEAPAAPDSNSYCSQQAAAAWHDYLFPSERVRAVKCSAVARPAADSCASAVRVLCM